jgi:restriction modification system DNA specificity domain protein
MKMQLYKLNQLLLDMHSGGTPDTSKPEYWNGDFKWLSSGETRQRFIENTESRITQLGIENSSTKLAKKNDVVMACAGQGKTRGQVSFLLDDMYINQSVIAMTTDEKILHPLYLFYNLLGRYNELRGSSDASSTRGSITTKSLKKLAMLIPNIDSQKNITDILIAYDNLIENNNKRIKLLEQMAENLYKEWFVRFRFPGYEDVEFIDGFPKDWEKVKLDDVLNKIATGLNPRKNFVLGEGENFYVTIKNMADNTVYLDDKCDKVNDDAIIKINKRSDLKIGDLLFSGIGTIGRVCLIDIPTNNWNISESVFTMRANNKISSEFLYMLLLSQDVQNYCQSKANGSAQKGIRMGDLRKYTFLLPTKNVINDFTNQISPILRNISLLRNENKNLIQQREMLLPRLMSGKLEV